MKDVEGKVAFITGGANGIGLGMAKVFTDAGMKVVIADIRQESLDKAMGHFRNTNKSVHAIRLDVSDRKAVEAAADETEKVFGKVHVVCNNAGINLFKPIDQCTHEDWQWVMGVNLWGVIHGVEAFVPRIKKHGEGGHIVNTASMASILSSAGAGIYSTAKFAVRGLSETLWFNLHPQGIGVSVLCPGLVDSNIHMSNEVRPSTLGKPDAAPEGMTDRMAALQRTGMDPVEVGEKVLAGIRADNLYIFPHPEFKAEVTEIFDEILAAMPEGAADPQRLQFEEMRRTNTAKARKWRNGGL
jgi:NAD(P)-dependent dehydrogenase (short-subunit alcohol dehydrogenase family)